MAADSPDMVTFELEADVFTLKMSSAGKCAFEYNNRLITADCAGATLDVETREVTFMGRSAGKISPNADVQGIANTINSWFPPGRVHHIHDEEDYNSKKAQGIVVCKFSAEWCGPCKMVKPKIDAMSNRYPDVTFVHIDGDENKAIFRSEGASCYPTFFFYKDGSKTTDKIEGADAAKVEAVIKKLGAVEQEVQTSISEGEVTIEVERDVFVVEKQENGVRLVMNGEEKYPAGKCPVIEVDRETRNVSLGGLSGKLFDGEQDLELIMTQLEKMFPTNVKHVHTEEEFDEIVKNNKNVIAKYSASWCGPCHKIAPVYTQLSNEVEHVVFLHIDVDKAKALSSREGVQAMPTFHFFLNGEKDAEKTIRGANAAQLKQQVGNLQK